MRFAPMTREAGAADDDRTAIAKAAASIPRSHLRQVLPKEQEVCVRAVLLSILGDYALTEYLSKGFQKK